MLRDLGPALVRARVAVALMLLVHLAAVAAGAILVHLGNASALRARDRLVASAHARDPASIALARGRRVEAAAWDFSRNLLLAAVPATVGGLAIVVRYVTAAYRGWVGGIVSVDRAHASRLADPRERTYYLVTLALQIVPYCLAGSAGVRAGLAFLRRRRDPGPAFLGIPRAAVRDVLAIYLLVIPLTAIASLWEFLAR